MGNRKHLPNWDEDFDPPSKTMVEELSKPLKTWFSPKIYGLDKIQPERPALYVSNHSVLGVTDGFFLGVEMYLQKDIMLRPLVDDLHNEVPFWRQLIRNVGMVPASRDRCGTLMQSGAHVLVFPGGRREVCKQKGEAYKLIWRNRTGFVHMAVEHGYDIIPVATIGAEELFDIMVDSQDIMRSPLGAWLHNTGIADRYFHGGENLPPIVKGLANTFLPRPERHYIKIGDRIPTEQFEKKTDDKDLLMGIRKDVESSFDNLFDDLKAYRNNDEDEEWWRWLLKKL